MILKFFQTFYFHFIYSNEKQDSLVLNKKRKKFLLKKLP